MTMTKFVGKCGAGIASAWNSMKRTAGNTKQDGRIADAENEITRLKTEIGNLTVIKLDEGLQLGEDVQERYDAICAARKTIAAAKASKKHIRITCPHCGHRTSAKMRFCGVCGKAL